MENGQTSLVSLSLEGELNLLLRNDEKVRVDYEIPNQLTALIDARQKVGSAKYYIDDNLYADIPIYTSDRSIKIDYRFCFLE